MLTGSSESASAPASVRSPLLTKAMSLEWLGQMVASICWIASVLYYGISSTGDQLQMAAASAWLVANVAAIIKIEK